MNREVRKVVTMQRYLMELKHIRKWVKKWRRRKHAKMRIYWRRWTRTMLQLPSIWGLRQPGITFLYNVACFRKEYKELAQSHIFYHPPSGNQHKGDEWVINCKAFFSLSNTFELSRLFQDCIDNFQSNFFPDWTTIASSFCFQDLSKLSVNCLSSADEQWGCAYAYEEDKGYAHDDEDYASEEDVNDDDLINDKEDDDGFRTIVHHRPSLIWMISGSSQAGQRDTVRYCSTNNEYKRTKRTLKTHEIIESSMHKSNKLRHWQDILWRELL